MRMLINFLKFCAERENNNIQNLPNTQQNFERFDKKYNGENVKDKKYKDVLDDCKEIHHIVLNRKDASAMEYRETGYVTANELTLKPNTQKGYKLTEDDKSITKLDSAAFITTAIVLQATLVLGLIISLLALVK